LRRVGIEIKRADAPKMTPSMNSALEDLDLHRLLLADAMVLPEHLAFAFATIVSIERVGAASPWRVMREFALT
jgi:hypothetical protein